ncbi:MAG: pyruvate ferredoxin oxidoreductase [Candidatus Omnitrophica bacterium]|jgi:pyruvate ferredoxin oxidoreductase alpha subunit|nr:pyruvate ferredoxin oxidoreductase [Candidatus Omnitrophota bacterium]
MRQFLEGSFAVAEAVKLCKPGVISAYPITPQTHIVERLADFVATGEMDSQFVNVESEHSAATVVLGAVATGVRVFTATSSQGLIYMSEVLFNIAGMRFPVVMVCANRALSAPINIWNDQQDAISLRDSGWVQIYAENNQEALDFTLQAYKLGENPCVMLPIMVNMDGFILTHGMETVDVPSGELVDKFLPPYKAPYKLDVENPMSFGLLGDPSVYLEARYSVHKTLEETLGLMPEIGKEFESVFGRKGLSLVESYKLEDAKTAIVAMGSVCGTIKDYVDSQREKGKKIGLLRVISYRPFPKDTIFDALKNVSKVLVLDKSISLGSEGPLYTEVKSLFANKKPKVSGFVAGLGGRDITIQTIKDMVDISKTKDVRCEFLNINQSLLKEEFYV